MASVYCSPAIFDTSTVVANAVYEEPVRQIEQASKGGNLQLVAPMANTTFNPYSKSLESITQVLFHEV